MGSKRFEKGSAEWELFQGYWKLCQTFWNPEESDEYWMNLMKATNEFYEKYKSVNEPFVESITLGFVESLEKKKKEIK